MCDKHSTSLEKELAQQEDLADIPTGKVTKSETSVPEVTTEVTSIAKEEQKTGQKVEIPTPEQMVENASTSHLQCGSILASLFPRLSSKAKTRVLMAALALPQEGMPVYLKSKEEQQCYGLASKMLLDKYIVVHKHVVDEQRKHNEQVRLAQEAKEKAEAEKGSIKVLTEEETKKINEELVTNFVEDNKQ